MWKTMFGAVVTVILIGVTILTLKLWIFGDKKKFGKIGDAITHSGWSLALLLLIPWFLGDYGRGQTSPIPWRAFETAYSKHGFWDAIVVTAMVAVVDLWALWLPGALYIEGHAEFDKPTRILVRSLNLSVGLLLLTPHNPFYWFIEWLPRSNPDDY
jgi:hypothetical protein